MRLKSAMGCTVGIVLAAVLIQTGIAQQAKSKAKGAPKTKAAKIADGDWPDYNRDSRSSRFSPLNQINTTNVAQIKEAWTYRPPAPPPQVDAPKDKGKGKGGRGGANGIGANVVPIVVNGMMYLPSGNAVIALNPATGEETWRYAGGGNSHGVTSWPGDSNNPARIIFTSGRNLIALNAKTGKLDPGFGKEGIVDMVQGWGGVPTIYKNTITVGASTSETPQDPNAPGDVRAFDARTGAKTWTFHTVPAPGEVGHETWLNEGWKDRSGTNIWAWHMTVDEERGLFFFPIGGPAGNYYGGDRPGANLFGNTVVAVNAETGKYKWHFQTVHHDLWDFDNPPAPVLIDIKQNERTIPALAQIGKSGWMYILNRETGKPIFGVTEKPVGQGDVPGEWYSPTQPIPNKPPALARMDFKKEDMVTAEDTNEEHAKACQALWDRSGGFQNQGPFTPFLFHEEGTPPHSTIIFPGATGGTNWGGMATDQNLGYVFVYSQNQGQIGWTEKKVAGRTYAPEEAQSKLEYSRASVDGGGPFFTFTAPAGAGLGNLPCQKPPWGTLSAVNANTGDLVWRVPVGITEGLGPAKQNTGRSGAFAGPTATAGGLVFYAGVSDGRFRAFDSKTGKMLWEVNLGTAGTTQPMVFADKNGKEYVEIVAGGAVHAFALP